MITPKKKSMNKLGSKKFTPPPYSRNLTSPHRFQEGTTSNIHQADMTTYRLNRPRARSNENGCEVKMFTEINNFKNKVLLIPTLTEIKHKNYS